MTIQSKDISIVFQGPVREETAFSIRKCRSLFPDAEIIFATWKGEHTEQILGVNKLIEIDDIPIAFVQHKRLGTKNNLNRLIRSTKVGIAASTRPYILKIRSDLILDSKEFLNTFDTFQCKGKMTVLRHKVVIPLLFSRRAYRANLTPFHLSDWAAFGLSKDIKSIFMETDEVIEPEFTKYFSSSRNSPFGSTTFRMAPEQWIYHSFFSRHYSKVMDDALDGNEYVSSLSDEFIVSNFIVADYKRTGFNLSKYPSSKDEVLVGSEFLDLWNQLQYEKCYKLYCDSDFVINHPDIEKIYRFKKTFKCKLKLKKHMLSLKKSVNSLAFITELFIITFLILKLILVAIFEIRKVFVAPSNL